MPWIGKLRQRYEPDYEVVSTCGAEAGLAVLSHLADEEREVIVVTASPCMRGMDATEFLTRAHATSTQPPGAA